MAIVDFNSAFWNDAWVRRLSPEAKVLFAFLWTNSGKNLIAMYSVDKETMCFHTGLSPEAVEKALKDLNPKVLYDHERSFVFVVNHVRHQYMRGVKVSEKIVQGIKKILLSTRHPFRNVFLKSYTDLVADFSILQDIQLFTDRVSIPYGEGIQSVGYPPSEGGGEGKGKGKEERGGVGEEGPPRRETPRLTKGVPEVKTAFEQFWEAYPAKNGKKLEEQETFRRFCLVPQEDWPDLIQAAKNYAASEQVKKGIGIKDPKNFLGNQANERPFWPEWIKPEKPPDEKTNAPDEIFAFLDKQGGASP